MFVFLSALKWQLAFVNKYELVKKECHRNELFYHTVAVPVQVRMALMLNNFPKSQSYTNIICCKYSDSIYYMHCMPCPPTLYYILQRPENSPNIKSNSHVRIPCAFPDPRAHKHTHTHADTPKYYKWRRLYIILVFIEGNSTILFLRFVPC